MARKQVHVVYINELWQVKVFAEATARATYNIKSGAVAYGRVVAKSLAPSELYIHQLDGAIGERETYGDDPYPPIG